MIAYPDSNCKWQNTHSHNTLNFSHVTVSCTVPVQSHKAGHLSLCHELPLDVDHLSTCLSRSLYNHKLVQPILLHAWVVIQGSRSLWLPHFINSQHMMVSRLSALCTRHLYPHPSGDNSGIPFCQRLGQPQGHSATRRIQECPVILSGLKIETFRLVAHASSNCTIMYPNHELVPFLFDMLHENPEYLCTLFPDTLVPHQSHILMYLCRMY